MPKEKINIVYIDDIIDEILSMYMNKVYCSAPFFVKDKTIKIAKDYKELTFGNFENYKALLQEQTIKDADVIIIDNHLFEERSIANNRFSGKQFKIILRKILPYIEVIIITQDETLTGANVIRKYSNKHGNDAMEYYKKFLEPYLDKAIKETLDFEDFANDLKQSIDVEKLLIDRVLDLLQGINSYDTLSKNDIDELISSFRELKDACK